MLYALLAEGVDRNPKLLPMYGLFLVALLAEGVDRNRTTLSQAGSSKVALLAEGVDRNSYHSRHILLIPRSPSSRRAWIEIKIAGVLSPAVSSPSSRRAWIEIAGHARAAFAVRVALLAEGVDRNASHRQRLLGAYHVALLAEGVDRN